MGGPRIATAASGGCGGVSTAIVSTKIVTMPKQTKVVTTAASRDKAKEKEEKKKIERFTELEFDPAHKGTGAEDSTHFFFIFIKNVQMTMDM